MLDLAFWLMFWSLVRQDHIPGLSTTQLDRGFPMLRGVSISEPWRMPPPGFYLSRLHPDENP